MKTIISERGDLVARNYYYKDIKIKGIRIYEKGTVVFTSMYGFLDHHDQATNKTWPVTSIEVEEPITSKKGLALADRLQGKDNFIMDGFLYIHTSDAQVETFPEQAVFENDLGAMMFTPCRITLLHTRLPEKEVWKSTILERSRHHYELSAHGIKVNAMAQAIKIETGVLIPLGDLSTILKKFTIERRA